jgi:hypothetical protein
VFAGGLVQVAGLRWFGRRLESWRLPAFCASGVVGTNMQGKLLVALQFEVAHHFSEGAAGGCARRVEDPSAFGATKALKTRLVNPYELSIHGGLSAPMWCDRTPRFPLAVKRRNALFRGPVGVPETVKGSAYFMYINLNGLSGRLRT